MIVNHSSGNNSQSVELAKVTSLNEIIYEILSRLPVKTLLQFTSVSKPMLSLIKNPSFANLYFARSTNERRRAIFISAYDPDTLKRHFFSAPYHMSGPLTHLLTLDDCPTNDSIEFTEAVHIKRMLDIQSVKPFKPTTIEIMIFCMSSLSWRKIDVDLPFDVCGDRWCVGTKHSVCVNSVIHVILQNEILAFDLRTEKFSIINIPGDAIPTVKMSSERGMNIVKPIQPVLMKIGGFLGVIDHNPVMLTLEMNIWILQDYENDVWVRETVFFLSSFFLLDGPFPLNPVIARQLAYSF
ncbi:putative F-box protein At1g50870 [Rutidosis leptorrhynchoides]|uniref:putative F-box protein At1g50870 n=1 Tax=Rutidosis leptorrhynchoides TaxID=125765 RepID=UPI003A98E152